MIRLILLLSVLHGAVSQIHYSIPEEQDPGSVVGNIAEDLGLDITKLSARRLRTLVSSSPTPYLEVNLENGALLVKEKIDREEICKQTTPCLLHLQVILEKPLELFLVDIEVLDINDNPPSFPETDISVEISESAIPGTRFPVENAFDPDVGTNALSTYAITNNNYFYLDVQTQSDGNRFAELVLEKPLDREQQAVHRYVLTAVDGGVPQRTGTALLVVKVLDSNDNWPTFDQSVYSINLPENSPVGTLVIQLNATDVDEGQNGEIVYSFSSHNTPRIKDLFSIDARTGRIEVAGEVDYEESNTHQIYVQAKDLGANAVPAHCKVLVKLVDVNDNTPEIGFSTVTESVSEQDAPGNVIALPGAKKVSFPQTTVDRLDTTSYEASVTPVTVVWTVGGVILFLLLLIGLCLIWRQRHRGVSVIKTDPTAFVMNTNTTTVGRANDVEAYGNTDAFTCHQSDDDDGNENGMDLKTEGPIEPQNKLQPSQLSESTLLKIKNIKSEKPPVGYVSLLLTSETIPLHGEMEDHPVESPSSSPHPSLELQDKTDLSRCFSGFRIEESISLPCSHSSPLLSHPCIENKSSFKAKCSHSLNDVTLLAKTQKVTPDIIVVEDKENYRLHCTQAEPLQCSKTNLSTPALRQQVQHTLTLSAEEKLFSVRSSFIDRVSLPNLNCLLDKLFTKEVLTDAEREVAAEIQAKKEKARFVIDTVRHKGPDASSSMILILCDLDTCLSKHLGLM